VQINSFEALRLQSVRRKRSDHVGAFGQPTTQAGMDIEPRLRIRAKQAVERVGERAVGRKQNWIGRTEDDI
jgi:hypothetical protein